MMKKIRNKELAKLYEEFQTTFAGPNFLPFGIMAQVPSIVAEVSRDEYQLPLMPGGYRFNETKERIFSQLPVIVNRFHHIVMDDYLNAVAGINTSSQENWVARFEAEEDTKLATPTETNITYARRALSFVDTQQGIVSYEMLEAVGWWTPLLPARRSVLRLAAMVLQQLEIQDDVSMSHMMSLGNVFLCDRCGSKEPMSWISLLEHFSRQQIIHGNIEIRNGVSLYDLHSDLKFSPVVKIVTVNEADVPRTHSTSSNAIFNPPVSCSL
ncbi:hypothetical protein SCHPADRAFT_717676 [Schizopora paradoxa]|uniref:Uncharacterized protein n=1 Tax=Schizopora paradoxa TaxID=27342 RepID=A0A0H2R1M7_9AGAM|nr:hypothetical protein SCHPADRAFT_717676 [Schizopora paradoxa]